MNILRRCAQSTLYSQAAQNQVGDNDVNKELKYNTIHASSICQTAPFQWSARRNDFSSGGEWGEHTRHSEWNSLQ